MYQKAGFEKFHRPTLGPLRPNVFTAVGNFLRCVDLAAVIDHLPPKGQQTVRYCGLYSR